MNELRPADSRMRFRSGLSLTLPRDWVLVDALEARGPDGLGVSVASYPVDPSTTIEDVAGADVLPGAEPVGVPEPATVVGRAGVLQRFESTDEAGRAYSHLAGYSLSPGRLYVARAAGPRDRIEEHGALLRDLISSAEVEAPERRAPGTGHGPSSHPLDQFLAGASVLSLDPYDGAVDFSALRSAWESGSRHAMTGIGDERLVLTGAELVAMANALGQPTFPGVDPATWGEAFTAEVQLARSTLFARALVRFPDDATVSMAPLAATVCERAFRAELVARVSEHREDARRATAFFIGPDGALELRSLPGATYGCGLLKSDVVMDVLMARLGGDPAAGSGPATVDQLTELGGDVTAFRIEVGSVHGDRIDLESRKLARSDPHGWYAEGDDGTWRAVDGPALRDALVELVLGPDH